MRIPRWCFVESQLAGSNKFGIGGIEGLVIQQRGKFGMHELCICFAQAEHRSDTRHSLTDSISSKSVPFVSGRPEEVFGGEVSPCC